MAKAIEDQEEANESLAVVPAWILNEDDDETEDADDSSNDSDNSEDTEEAEDTEESDEEDTEETPDDDATDIENVAEVVVADVEASVTIPGKFAGTPTQLGLTKDNILSYAKIGLRTETSLRVATEKLLVITGSQKLSKIVKKADFDDLRSLNAELKNQAKKADLFGSQRSSKGRVATTDKDSAIFAEVDDMITG